MPLPSTSSPFDYLVRQIREDLDHAAELCRQIKKSRHVGTQHTQLDALENALADGAGYVLREKRNYADLEGADLDGGDDFARADFTGYVRQVEEINARLDAIAHPPTHHPDHRHHHQHTLFCDPKYHKSKEDPHFHELRLKWENVRDGIPQTFAQLKYRLDTKAADKKKEKEAKDKAKKEKDEAVEKLEKEAEELKKKITKEERHQEERREVLEGTQDKRDKVVESLVKTTLEKDPIDNLDHLATVMGHIQHVITPRSSHSAFPVPLRINVNSSASGTGYGEGGSGGSSRAICSEDHRGHVCWHDLDHRLSRSQSHHYHRSRSSSASPPPHRRRSVPIIIDNNVWQTGAGETDGFSVDEASSVSSHGTHYHGLHLTEHAHAHHNGHHHGHRRPIGPVPLVVNGVHGSWNPEHHHEHHEVHIEN